jgi:hypothetical protein
MSTTIEAIMRHLVPPAKREPARKASAIVLAQKQSGSNELSRRREETARGVRAFAINAVTTKRREPTCSLASLAHD